MQNKKGEEMEEVTREKVDKWRKKYMKRKEYSGGPRENRMEKREKNGEA